MTTIHESVKHISWRPKKKSHVVGNYPSLPVSAIRWPRLWRDAADRSRNQRFGYDIDIWGGEVRAWKYGMMMKSSRFSNRLCKVLVVMWSFLFQRHNRPFSFQRRRHHEAFDVVLTGDHSSTGYDEQGWRTRFSECARGDGPSVGS